MRPGDKFKVEVSFRKDYQDLKRFCSLRYMKNGAMVRLELVGPGIVLVSL